MWIVSRANKVFRADFLDHFDRRLLVDIKRYVTLALEVLAWQHRKLLLASGAELFPMVVEAPEPPAEPSRSALEECAAQLRMPLEHAAGGHARHRHHQFHRSARRMRDRLIIVVPDEPAPDIILERAVPGRMESDRHIEPLQFIPQWLDRLVVQMQPVDRGRRPDDRDGAQFIDASARLLHRKSDVM